MQQTKECRDVMLAALRARPESVFKAAADLVESLEQRLEQSKKLYELTLSNEIRWMQKHSEIEGQLAQAKASLKEMRSILRTSLKIPQAWMGRRITFKQWDEACQKVFDAIGGL